MVHVNPVGSAYLHVALVPDSTVFSDTAVRGNFFMGVECGFEYNLVLPNRVQLSVTQKNQVSFLHGDTFRNGLLVGLKIPF